MKFILSFTLILSIFVMNNNKFTGRIMETYSSDKHDLPCAKDKLLETQKISQLIKELDNWKINDEGHLCKLYMFSDFTSAMNFANKITKIAEREGHHPNLTIGWGKCEIEIYHHILKGLTEKDFILAAKIDHEMRKATAYLLNKNCVPFQKIKLQPERISELKKGLNGWEINNSGHLYKDYKFPDFVHAMNFGNKVQEIAEREWHHPELKLSWGKCRLEIWTHAIDGLTENDFILAAKIDHENR